MQFGRLTAKKSFDTAPDFFGLDARRNQTTKSYFLF